MSRQAGRGTARSQLTRRSVLRGLGLGIAAAPLVHLVGCGFNPTVDTEGTDGGGTADAGSDTDAGLVSGEWAVGTGTFLTGKSYANPFASGAGSSCTVYKSVTEGPCHSNTFDRQDVTEGQVGLPMRLTILVVDTSCQPVPNAKVEIWHCSTDGLYSGAPVNGSVGSDLQVGMCTANEAAALAAGWFRGYRTAGVDGIVTFDTLFPGWYSSRAVHIHFRVSVGAQEYAVSQFFIDETLKEDVYSSHATYTSRPTTMNGYVRNSSDKVVMESGLTLSDVVLETAKQSDGALLAWKAITIAG